MNDKIILEGAISVKAAIESKSREIISIYVDKNKKDRNISYIINVAKNQGNKIIYSDKEKISAITTKPGHGGICAEVSPRIFTPCNKIIDEENPFIVLLDGIEDPYNFGDCIRSAYAAGATGLFISERDWSNADAILARASAGASEKLKTAKINDFLPVLYAAKEKNVTIVAADRKNAVPLNETTLSRPLILAVGGRLRGLSKVIYDLSDMKVFIPYKNDFKNALSASAACAVMCFSVH